MDRKGGSPPKFHNQAPAWRLCKLCARGGGRERGRTCRPGPRRHRGPSVERRQNSIATAIDAPRAAAAGTLACRKLSASVVVAVDAATACTADTATSIATAIATSFQRITTAVAVDAAPSVAVDAAAANAVDAATSVAVDAAAAIAVDAATADVAGAGAAMAAARSHAYRATYHVPSEP